VGFTVVVVLVVGFTVVVVVDVGVRRLIAGGDGSTGGGGSGSYSRGRRGGRGVTQPHCPNPNTSPTHTIPGGHTPPQSGSLTPHFARAPTQAQKFTNPTRIA
jgi:hypothetical protein